MKQKSVPGKAPADQVIKDIRRQTRRHYSAEEKIRIVLEGLRGEENISELCRREGIAASMYYGWSKEFLEAGKRRLASEVQLKSAGAWQGRVGKAKSSSTIYVICSGAWGAMDGEVRMTNSPEVRSMPPPAQTVVLADVRSGYSRRFLDVGCESALPPKTDIAS